MIKPVQIAAKNAGGVVALARALGIEHPSLHSWKRVPAARVLQIEELSGIPRHELRPDIFGPAPCLPKTRGSNAGVAA